VLAAPMASAPATTPAASISAIANAPAPSTTSSDVTTTGGTVNAIPLFSTATNIQNSIITQTAKTAINVLGKLNLPAIGTATSSAGKNSQGQTFAASSYDSSTSTAVAQTFQLQAEAAGNDTSSPSGTLNVLFGEGTSAPAETGLKINNKGLITFVKGQTFPGTAVGTITGITTASGSGLSGGGTGGTLSLNIPPAGVTNTMLANPSITLNANSAGGLTTPGVMSLGSTNTIGLKPCSANQVLEYSGSAWTCAAAATGTITGVTAGPGLSGGGTTGTVTVSLNSAQVPLLTSANTFTASQTVNGTLGAQFGSFNGSNSSQDVYVNNSGSGDGVDSYSAQGFGIYAQSNGFDAGFFYAENGGSFGIYSEADEDSTYNAAIAGFERGATQANIGVWGFAGSPVGIGSYSEAYGASVEGSTAYAIGNDAIGLWADTSASLQGVALFATADNAQSFAAANNSSISLNGADAIPTGWFENDETTDDYSWVLGIMGGNSGDQCIFDVSANLYCDGIIVENAGLVTKAGAKVALYGVTAAEDWSEDAGGGQLSNGSAVVNLDDTFAQTVNTGVEYRVFLTPNGDCKGLYVSQKSATSFEVHELGGGTSNIAFDYRIMAKRRGYENLRLAERNRPTMLPLMKKRPRDSHAPSPDGVRKAHMQRAEQLRKMASTRKNY
jgi:hypothetical protein